MSVKVENGDLNSPYAVEFKNASLSYGGGENALNNINLKIKRGETV